MVLRTTRITVKTDTVLIVHRARATVGWCPECSAQVDIITFAPEGLAEPATSAELDRWISTGKLHLWHSPEATVQVCVNSLLQCADLRQPPSPEQTKE